MGKYMRNSKSNNVIDGVRTRAKTLALQTQILSPTPTPSSPVSASSFGYLQLRNRRLLRLKPPVSRKVSDCETPNLIGNPNFCNSDSNSRVRVLDLEKLGDFSAKLGGEFDCDGDGDGDGDCFGENAVESDLRESRRSTRESTPSNLIRDPDAIHTPASSTRPTYSSEATRRLRSSMQRNIPTSHEMEEFFADAEEQQQREFIQKYNFDPANDKPLPGRYEWKKLKP